MTSKRIFLAAGVLLCAAAIGILRQQPFRTGPSAQLVAPPSSGEHPVPASGVDDKANPPPLDWEVPSSPPLSRIAPAGKGPGARERLREIASKGTPADWQAFLDSTSASGAREALLECIGESGRTEASAFLKEGLNAEAQTLRRAAIRGLAATGRIADAGLLRDIMLDPSIAIEETTEAALALGGARAANAAGILMKAYSKNGEEALQQCIVIGLAQRPFQESESFFRQMLADPLESASRKKDALESLGQFDTVKDAFFIPFIDSPETDVRRGAYQGLGKLVESQLGYLLLNSLQKEPEELARADIYEALCSKSSGNRVLLNQIASAEADPMIRLIAARAVGSSLREASESDPLVGVFERQWVPTLTQSGLRGSKEEGMQAVFALMSAQSFRVPRQALEQIGAEAADPKVRELAQRALHRSKIHK